MRCGFSSLVSSTVIALLVVSQAKANLFCNVTAVSYAVVTVDLVLLQVAEDDFTCLFGLNSIVGALATSSDGGSNSGLVVDSVTNSSRLFLLPLSSSLVDYPSGNSSVWIIEDGHCWLHLNPLSGFEGTIHEMDVHDHLVLKSELQLFDPDRHIVQAMSLLPEYFWFIQAEFEESGVFAHRVDLEPTLTGRNISLHIWQKNSNPTVSNVTVSWMMAPQTGCSQSKLTVTIRSGCPSLKMFRFIYPEDQNPEWINLPVNYRSPSHHGSSIPTSPHVYNADPTQSLMKNHFKISQNAALKQCRDKVSREECGCREEEDSQNIDISDCISRVYRQPYQKVFQLEFTISLGNELEEQVRYPISIVEVNGRTSFNIQGLRDGYLLPGASASIVFQGPELFHFEAKVVNSTSFCNLTTHFAVYVDRVPLLRAAEYSIIVSSTFIFGAFTIAMYLIHHFKPKTPVQHLIAY